MANLPEPKFNLVDEGHYSFRVTQEPEVRKTGDKKWLIVKFDITDENGNTRSYSDVFFPSDDKYHKLLFAAGAEPDEKGVPHLSDMDTRELVGAEFDGDIEHIADRKDSTKIRDTIVNVTLREEEVTKSTPSRHGPEDEDVVPF